jgi:hypothetical protein
MTYLALVTPLLQARWILQSRDTQATNICPANQVLSKRCSI